MNINVLLKLIKLLLLLTVFLIPLLGAYKGLGYEQIKVLFFILSISLIAFVWLLQKPVIKLSGIGKTAVVFILILFLTSLGGLDFKTSFLGSPPYFQGLLIYSYLFLFYLLIRSFNIGFKYYSLSLTASALIVSLRAIEDWVSQNFFNMEIPTYAGRVVSSFGQPNFYAGFLLLALPFTYYLFKKGSQLMILIMIVLMAGIFVSYSRSSILLSLILFTLALFDQLKIRFKFFLAVLIILLIACVIALKSSSGIVGSEFSRPFLTNNPDLTKESVEKRAYIWPQIFKIILQKPFTGFGLENINTAFSAYFIKNKHLIFEENLNISPVLISLKDLNIDRSHNYLLDLLVFSGILGLVTWLLLIGFLIKKNKNKYLFVSLLTYLIWIQFQNQSIVHIFGF